MNRLLLVGAAFAAGWLAKRARDAYALPLIVPANVQVDIEPAPPPTVEQADLWPLVQPRGDHGVLSALAMLDEHQIASAEMALNRPLPDEVQTLASMLRDEHREHLARTNELVDQLGVELEVDSTVAQIEGRCFLRRAELGSANDDDFEQLYLDDVVDDHERMLEFLDAALLPAVSDDRVATHLRHTRDHLAAHLAEARMLA